MKQQEQDKKWADVIRLQNEVSPFWLELMWFYHLEQKALDAGDLAAVYAGAIAEAYAACKAATNLADAAYDDWYQGTDEAKQDDVY